MVVWPKPVELTFMMNLRYPKINANCKLYIAKCEIIIGHLPLLL